MSEHTATHKTRTWKTWNRVQLNPDTIRRWRLAKQLTHWQAAEACKMCEVTFRRCEAGQPVLALTAERLAQHLGMPIEELRVK